MKLRTIILPVIALSALSACGSRDKDAEGTSVSINAKDKDGDVAINADGKTGKVSVNLPGFNADDTGGKGDAKVRVAFESPAGMAKVRDWFKSGFDDEGIKFTETPGGFTGTTGDGNAFVVTLAPGSAAATSGTIDING